MQTDPSHSPSGEVEAGSVVGIWRYPVKSMMGEELNAAEVTKRWLVGDRQFALVDAATGKVAGAKNPRKWATSSISVQPMSSLRRRDPSCPPSA